MWKNNIKYTTPKRFDFRLNDFTGGICNTVTESRIKTNEASDLLNVRFEQDGLLKKRSGFSLDKKFGELLHGLKGSLLRVFVVEPASTTKKGYLLLVDGKRMAYVTTEDKVIVMPWNRAVSTNSIDGCQFGDKFFFVDGGVYINFFKIKELETGDDKKVFHYMVSKPPGDFVPKPKPATKGEWKEKEYPGSLTAKSYWYEPCQAEMEDGYKGTNVCEKFFGTMCRVHKDRLYIAGNIGRTSADIDPDPNTIYISDIMNPVYFPASLPLQTPPTGDKITCLRQFNDALIVGRKDDIYAVHGNSNRMDSSQQFTLKKINTHTGIANNYSADTIFNFLFYVGSDGNCYKLTSTSTSVELLATQQVNQKIDFKLPPFNKDISEIVASHTAFDPIRGEWHIQVGNDTFVYNYRNFAWVRWKGVECMQFISTDDKFFYVKDDGSFYIIDENIFYDMSLEYPELRIPIQFYWVSKNIDFDTPSRIKQIRDTFLISEIIGTHPSDIRVKYEADYVAVTKEHNISSEVARWNLAKWDEHRFVYKNIIRSLPIMVGRRCRNFKVFIGNGYEFKGVYGTLPAPQSSEEGELYYLRNFEQPPNLYTGILENGGIDGTTGSLIDNDDRYIRTYNSISLNTQGKYEITIQHKHEHLITTVLMYDTSDKYLGCKYCSYDDGYIFETIPNTAKVKLSFTDATTGDLLDNQEITILEIRKYLQHDLPDPIYPDGFYIRTKRDSETRTYYKKMYDKDLYQPVKIHEINGIYELRGYR